MNAPARSGEIVAMERAIGSLMARSGSLVVPAGDPDAGTWEIATDGVGVVLARRVEASELPAILRGKPATLDALVDYQTTPGAALAAWVREHCAEGECAWDELVPRPQPTSLGGLVVDGHHLWSLVAHWPALAAAPALRIGRCAGPGLVIEGDGWRFLMGAMAFPEYPL